MSCQCNCGCSVSCSCYDATCGGCAPKCTTTTTTTTINPNCNACEEVLDCQCIVYSGPNVECYGLKNGDSLCNILENVINRLSTCNTTLPPLSCNFTATVTYK